MDRHIILVNELIQSKLESLPRAISGKASNSVLEATVDKINLLKEIKDVLINTNNA